MFDLPKETFESILVIIGILENPSARKFLHPISVETYFKLGEQNLISDNTELIEGVIFQKMPKSPLHYSITQKLVSYFINKLTSQFMARQEGPILIKGSSPEPDIAIVNFNPDYYSTSHPEFANLIIEISLSTLEFDREKADVYASGNIPEYWIFNLKESILEVFLQPENGNYKIKKIFQKQDTIYPEFDKNLAIFIGDFFL